MRVQKFLRDLGLGSLRKCDEFVAKKQVFINDTALCDPTYYLEEGDRVKFREKTYIFNAKADQKEIYLKFNKPPMVLSSKTDKFGRKLVYDFLNKVTADKPLFYGGRLDYLSRGLMIFSTDGDFINKLSHPSFGITKEYIVTAEKDLDFTALQALSSGFNCDSTTYAPFSFTKISGKKVSIILNEGKKQEVRVIIKQSGNKVKDLLRTRIGEYTLGSLTEGSYELLE